MANIHVTYADLTAAGNQLQTGQQDLESKLQELKGYMDSLVAEGYVTDQSSGAFHEQYTQFTANASSCVGALEGMATFLRSAAQTMEQTDASLASAIRG